MNYLKYSRAILIGAILAAAPLSAATFTVNDLGDTGPGTLRQAIIDANAAAGPDTIVFDSALEPMYPATITLQSALPDLVGGITIEGPSRHSLTVSRQSGTSYRFFNVSGAQNPLAISNITLDNGRHNQNASGGGGGGGAIRAEDTTLIVRHVWFTHCGVYNAASSGEPGRGGAIYAYNSNTTIENARFDDCVALHGGSVGGSGMGAYGGALYLHGSFTVHRIWCENCDCVGGQGGNGDGGHAYGGGAYLEQSGGGIAEVHTAIFVSCTATGGNSLMGGDGGAAFGGGAALAGDITIDRMNFQTCVATGGDATGTGNFGGNAHGGGLAKVATGSIELSRFIVIGCDVVPGQNTTVMADAGRLGSALYSTGDVTVHSAWIFNCIVFPAAPSAWTIYLGGDHVFHSLSMHACNRGMRVAAGAFTLTNITISGNALDGTGAALRAENGATVTLEHGTIFNNTGASGGVVVESTATSFSVSNSILAGNSPEDASGASSPGITTGGNNIVGVEDANGWFVNGVSADQVGTSAVPLDPMLSALASNGGWGHTHIPLSGSPALEAANSSLTRDGRYARRPADGDGDSTATSDVGAVEFQNVTPSVTLPGGTISLATQASGLPSTAVAIPMTGTDVYGDVWVGSGFDYELSFSPTGPWSYVLEFSSDGGFSHTVYVRFFGVWNQSSGSSVSVNLPHGSSVSQQLQGSIDPNAAPYDPGNGGGGGGGDSGCSTGTGSGSLLLLLGLLSACVVAVRVRRV